VSPPRAAGETELARGQPVCYTLPIMRLMGFAILAGGLCLAAQGAGVEAAVFVYVDAAGTAHFTDAPTKPHYQHLPAFGLPRNANLTRGQYADLINGIAVAQGVDPALVKAIIRAESGFDQRAVSRKGAQGLMQLMPETAGRYAVGDAFDPADNIRGGVQYLRFLQDLFPGQLHLAVAAYNAGENAVLRHGGIPPYAETRDYVSRVLRFYGQSEPVVAAQARETPRPAPRRERAPAATSSGPSTQRIYRQTGADGTTFYTNLPPLVRSPKVSTR
jgi:hypothetical protein